MTRLARRDAFQVRRDAAVELGNGRVAFDALFTRWGVQDYPGGVEFRPFAEVEASMATLGALPGTLLHPSQNYGTKFDTGAYPVRGCTAEHVQWADDGIHTQGRLIVWDGDWLDAIMSAEVAELSAGYTVNFDETPGEAPDGAPGTAEMGREYVGVHREIIGDHMAGVPEGNAGTARVMLDAATCSTIPRVTRRALADIAASRMDARPMYIDLGAMAKSWPQRETQDQEPEPMNKAEQYQAKLDELAKAGRLDSKTRADAWVDIYGETNDPDMLAMLSGLATSPTPTAPATPAAPVDAVADAEEEEPKDPPAEEKEEPEEDSKMDRAKARLDAIKAEDARADAMWVGRSLFGPAFDGRADGKRMSTEAVQLACLGKMDAERSDDITRLDAADRRVAIRLDFAQLKRRVDAKVYQAPIEDLVAACNQARGDTRTTAQDELAEAMAKHDAITTQAAIGRAPKKAE